MIEWPEAVTYKDQLRETLVGKTVKMVLPPASPHKFCWFEGDVNQYQERLEGRSVTGTDAFGIYVEILFDANMRLAFNDGVNPRLIQPTQGRPEKYQLLVEFTDGWSLVFTVAMYGGIVCHGGEYEGEYYIKSKNSISPLSGGFDFEYFTGLGRGLKPSLSVKAFLAAERRIPGLGNGCLQDVLSSGQDYEGVLFGRNCLLLSGVSGSVISFQQEAETAKNAERGCALKESCGITCFLI